MPTQDCFSLYYTNRLFKWVCTFFFLILVRDILRLHTNGQFCVGSFHGSPPAFKKQNKNKLQLEQMSNDSNCLCLFELTRNERSSSWHTWGSALEMRLDALRFKCPLSSTRLKRQSVLLARPVISPLPNNKTAFVPSPPDSCYQRGLQTHHTLDAPPSTLSPVKNPPAPTSF